MRSTEYWMRVARSSPGDRHLLRRDAAVARGVTGHRIGRVRAALHADGRTAFPDVVRYRLGDGSLVDLPPTAESHPDAALAGRIVPSVAYEVVVRRLADYEALLASGALGAGHAYLAAETVVDHRRAPGA